MHTSLQRLHPVAAVSLLLVAALALFPVPASATLTHVVRADFQNPTRTPGNNTNAEPGVIFYSGHLVGPNTLPPEVPKGGGYVLQESSFGQPFSPFVMRSSTNSPLQSYGDEVTAGALAVLYPNPQAGKTAVEASTAAFRYKYLLFAPNTTNGVTRTVADFDGINAWFGPNERRLVEQQITNLVEALAFSPLHTGLRTALLDAYTDRAIAELQFNKCDLVELGKKRLGLTLTGEFIIGEEINLLSNVVARLEGVLSQYASLLSRPLEGVEPADFDGRAIRGTPFGYYLFKTEQPARNANAPQYFNTNGTLLYVPDYDPVAKEIARVTSAESFTDSNNNGFYDAGEPFVDANNNGIYDAGATLFNGFKDYTTLLSVMGEYV